MYLVFCLIAVVIVSARLVYKTLPSCLYTHLTTLIQKLSLLLVALQTPSGYVWSWQHKW